jgi:outer membrane protein assembly factor BamA
MPLDADEFNLEKARIVNLFKDNGYADFNGNFIEFRGDSTETDVAITVFIYNPVGKSKHKKYSIGDIHVYTEHLPSQDPFAVRRDSVNQMYFYAKSDKFAIRPKSISDVITLQKGETFRKTDEARTNRNLSRLSAYRFVVLDPFILEDIDTQYHYNIFLTPHRHKWVFDMGLNLFYSSISQIGRNLFGFTGNVGFTNRNFRNTTTRYSLNLENTFEFQLNDFTDLNLNSLSIQLNNSFEIPKVIDIFRITGFLNKLNIIDDTTLDNINENGTTDIDVGLGLTSIRDFYDLNSFNASWSYDFQPNQRLRYIIRQIGINIIDTEIKDRFREEILANNPLLELSLADNLFTGFVFREFSIFKRTRETENGSSFAFIGNFELSGFENFLINRLVNAVSSYNDWWRFADLEFSEFFRLEFDARYYKKTRPRASFASRINLALARPYGNDDVVPYVKQYFVGGPNSIRGWQLRELGPGGYSELLLNPIEDQPFFQAGDFKLEFNLEYRFDLFWLLEGAFFLDGGNVWTLKNDPQRPGAVLSSDFFNQIAMSLGWGLRWDFDFFIFRFDFGYKLRNPFPDPETGEQFILTDGRYNGIIGNVNFAINYPF